METHPAEIKRRVFEIWENILDVPNIQDSSDFFTLGGDSLAVMIMIQRVENTTGITAAYGTIYTHSRAGDFIRELLKQSRDDWLPYATPMRISGTLPPLFMIPAAQGGAFHFRELVPLLSINQPCYCLTPRIAANGEHNYQSIPHLASLCVELIRSLQPQGPYRIIGYSFGGVLSWEIAHQLEKAHEKVETLIMCDSSADHYKLRWDGKTTFKEIFNVLAVGIETHCRNNAIPHFKNIISLSRDKVTNIIKYRLRKKQPHNQFDMFSSHGLTKDYHYSQYLGKLTLLRARNQRTVRRALDYELGWGPLLKLDKLTIYPIKGDHVNFLLPPSVCDIAKKINQSLRKADKNYTQQIDQETLDSSNISLPVFHEPTEGLSLTERFKTVASTMKHRTAIRDGGHTISFNELDQLSTQIALAIRSNYGDLSEPVLLYFSNSWQFIVALYAVLKSGKYYLPVDTSFPRPRVRQISKLSNSRIAISMESDLPTLQEAISPENVHVETFENLQSNIFQSSSSLPAIPADLPAALLFTSGSSAEPKGLLCSHAMLTHTCWRRASGAGYSPKDRYLQIYSTAFMGALMAIHGALLSGACLCIYQIHTRGIDGLASWVAKERITIFHAVTSLYRKFVTTINPAHDLSSIRVIHPGGEPSRVSDIESFKRYFPASSTYYTSLGSTECGTIAFFPISHSSGNLSTPLPVGVPFSSMNVFLLDKNGNKSSMGEEGEITVKSRFIFHGYWNSSEDHKSILEHTPNGYVTFKTGDYGRFNQKGELINLGRKDTQIKINGYRVEITEIETALLRIPGILEAVVIQRNSSAKKSDPILVAFYTCSPTHQETSQESIRSTLYSLLPTAMIPSLFFQAHQLPATLGKKVDRKLLQELPFDRMIFLLHREK